MKNRFESSEVFTAYATIEAGYYMIRELQTKLDKETSVLPIERMVDAATGADKERLDVHKKQISAVLLDIIEAKKVVEADCSKDEELLLKISELLK